MIVQFYDFKNGNFVKIFGTKVSKINCFYNELIIKKLFWNLN